MFKMNRFTFSVILYFGLGILASPFIVPHLDTNRFFTTYGCAALCFLGIAYISDKIACYFYDK